ncbi:MAG: hypothetical protein K9N49_01590 [Candidatus Marinimicrobia bacterium]|nr:hypothetical protein [Candidatus Neomarinimicrobiota bacterium]
MITSVKDRWCLHSYYTLCPYAPDGSGRLLLAGADLATNQGEVLILAPDGEELDRFGKHPVTPSFWHTACWQSWSPDSRFVYYQAGTLQAPITVRRELATGAEIRLAGDLEGIPPSGEPGISCSHGLLYAAGYGDNKWKPDEAPVPFLERRRHGMSEVRFDPPAEKLILSTQDILDRHPERDRLLAAEKDLQGRLGAQEGLTLMTYCVRWNRQGTRFLFYFGNHCVVRARGEPRVAYIFTADRDLTDIRLALDISFDRRGVHWGWQPDGEMLIGYGPRPDGQPGTCLAEVRWDGTDYRMLSEHDSGGHPSASPRDHDLLVSDHDGPAHDNVVFISRRSGEILERVPLPKFIGDREPRGRNPLRVCHHPVFNLTGDRLLCNSLPNQFATPVEIQL